MFMSEWVISCIRSLDLGPATERTVNIDVTSWKENNDSDIRGLQMRRYKDKGTDKNQKDIKAGKLYYDN